MTEFWVMNVTDMELVSTETCSGNAAELMMVLEEMNPDIKFSVERIEILEKVE
jgi:hypothetical protein